MATASRPDRVAAKAPPALNTQALLLGELIGWRQGQPVVRHPGVPEDGVLARVLGNPLPPGLPPPALGALRAWPGRAGTA